ncbi:hypothetical protein [Nonomuraea rubra]|uniref:hypothetical protein n=1 Tax=Nonomuraea rubra TaxID=46180 RepID=UPI003CD060B8
MTTRTGLTGLTADPAELPVPTANPAGPPDPTAGRAGRLEPMMGRVGLPGLTAAGATPRGDQAGDAHRQGAGQGDREDDGRREHTRGQADDPAVARIRHAGHSVGRRAGGRRRHRADGRRSPEIGGGETGTGEGRGGEGGSRVAGVARPYRVPLLEVPGDR